MTKDSSRDERDDEFTRQSQRRAQQSPGVQATETADTPPAPERADDGDIASDTAREAWRDANVSGGRRG